MIDVKKVQVVGDEVPADVIAPFECDCGHGWLAPLLDVIKAAYGEPLVCPGCGRGFLVGDLGEVGFAGRAEWEAAPDGEAPEMIYVTSAFPVPLNVTRA